MHIAWQENMKYILSFISPFKSFIYAIKFNLNIFAINWIFLELFSHVLRRLIDTFSFISYSDRCLIFHYLSNLMDKSSSFKLHSLTQSIAFFLMHILLVLFGSPTLQHCKSFRLPTYIKNKILFIYLKK